MNCNSIFFKTSMRFITLFLSVLTLLPESHATSTERQCSISLTFKPSETQVTLQELVQLRLAIAEASLNGNRQLSFSLAREYRKKLLQAEQANLPLSELQKIRTELEQIAQGQKTDADEARTHAAEAELKYADWHRVHGFENASQVRMLSTSPVEAQMVQALNNNTVEIVDLNTGRILHELTGPTHHVTSLAYSGNGKRVIAREDNKKLLIWDVQTGKLLRKISANTIADFSLNFEGTEVLTAGLDPNGLHFHAIIYDVRTGLIKRIFEHEEERIKIAQFSKDGSRVFTVSANNGARIWDANTGATLANFVVERESLALSSFSPNGNYLVARVFGSSEFNVYDALTGEYLHKIDPKISFAKIMKVGNTSVIFSGIMGDVAILDLQSGALQSSFKTAQGAADTVYIFEKTGLILNMEQGGRVTKLDLATGNVIGIFSSLPNDLKTKRYEWELGKTVASHDGSIVIGVFPPLGTFFWKRRQANEPGDD